MAPKENIVTECVPWEVPALGAAVSHWELPGAAPPAPVPLLPRTRKAKTFAAGSVFLLSYSN